MILRLLFFLSFCTCFYLTDAQRSWPALGRYSKTNTFHELSPESAKIAMHSFLPLSESSVGYNSRGQSFKMDRGDTILNRGVYEGKWNNTTRKWLLFYSDKYASAPGTNDCYIPIESMRDIGYIPERPNPDAQKRSFANANSKKVFFTGVLPILIALLLSIYFLNFFYISLSRRFSVIAGHPVSGCLGALIMLPLLILLFQSGSIMEDKVSNGVIDWLFSGLGLDKDVLKRANDNLLSYGQILHMELAFLLVILVVLFSLWIGIGLAIAGIVVLCTSGSGPTATGYSHDGGRTVHITSISPGSPPLNIDFSKIVLGWLIYSLLFPFMCWIANFVWSGQRNIWRPMSIGLLLTVGTSLLYRKLDRKNSPVTRILARVAASLLGFAMLIVTIFLVIMIVHYLVVLLK